MYCYVVLHGKWWKSQKPLKGNWRGFYSLENEWRGEFGSSSARIHVRQNHNFKKLAMNAATFKQMPEGSAGVYLSLPLPSVGDLKWANFTASPKKSKANTGSPVKAPVYKWSLELVGYDKDGGKVLISTTDFFAKKLSSFIEWVDFSTSIPLYLALFT